MYSVTEVDQESKLGWQGCVFFLEVLGENPFPYLFYLPETDHLHFQVRGPVLIFRASNVASSSLLISSLHCCF